MSALSASELLVLRDGAGGKASVEAFRMAILELAARGYLRVDPRTVKGRKVTLLLAVRNEEPLDGPLASVLEEFRRLPRLRAGSGAKGVPAGALARSPRWGRPGEFAAVIVAPALAAHGLATVKDRRFRSGVSMKLTAAGEARLAELDGHLQALRDLDGVTDEEALLRITTAGASVFLVREAWPALRRLGERVPDDERRVPGARYADDQAIYLGAGALLFANVAWADAYDGGLADLGGGWGGSIGDSFSGGSDFGGGGAFFGGGDGGGFGGGGGDGGGGGGG